MNQPAVEAAYYDWTVSVERITTERSLPDPKLTFQAYIQDSLTSLMPGLAQDFPGPGKLKAAAAEAAAGSRSKYFAFESSALNTAFAVKQAYYQLWFLDEKIRINRETLNLLADLEKSPAPRTKSARHAAGRLSRANRAVTALLPRSPIWRIRAPTDGPIQRRPGPHPRPAGSGAAGPL